MTRLARLLDQLLDQLLDRGGSHLHLSIGHPPTMRRQGRLHPLRDAPVDEGEMIDLLDALLDDHQRRAFAEQHDLDLVHAHGDRARFRVSLLMKTTGPGAVLRAIPPMIPTAEQLGLPRAAVRLAERRAGLVVVAGPPGSGKTTTLATLVAHLDHTRPGHVLVIEDRLERWGPTRGLVTHREVGVHTPDFAEALRSAEREDPDAIVVDELRGPSAMRLVLGLAGSGALVLAAMRTPTVAATIDRLLDASGPEHRPMLRPMLADALVGVVARRPSPASGPPWPAPALLLATPEVTAIIREGPTSALLQHVDPRQADHDTDPSPM